MKKAVLLASIVALPILFASCKKDYDCVCTITSAGKTTTSTYVLGRLHKKDAVAACDQKKVGIIGYNATCKLN